MTQKVQVWIYSKEGGALKILLMRRIPAGGGFWQPVTGKVEPGETLEHAALREAAEESGLKWVGELESLEYSFEFPSRWGGKAREHVYRIEAEFASPTLDPKEHDAFEWVSREEAQKRIPHTPIRAKLEEWFA